MPRDSPLFAYYGLCVGIKHLAVELQTSPSYMYMMYGEVVSANTG
jgi:hypothetical protein